MELYVSESSGFFVFPVAKTAESVLLYVKEVSTKAAHRPAPLVFSSGNIITPVPDKTLNCLLLHIAPSDQRWLNGLQWHK